MEKVVKISGTAERIIEKKVFDPYLCTILDFPGDLVPAGMKGLCFNTFIGKENEITLLWQDRKKNNYYHEICTLPFKGNMADMSGAYEDGKLKISSNIDAFHILLSINYYRWEREKASWESASIAETSETSNRLILDIEKFPDDLLPPGMKKLCFVPIFDKIALLLQDRKGLHRIVCVLPFKDKFGTDIWGTYNKEMIEISTRYGGGTYITTNYYKWKGKKAAWESSTGEDVQEDEIEKVHALISQGKFRESMAIYDNIMYPSHYFSVAELNASMLLVAQRMALSRYRQKDLKTAVDIMKQAVSLQMDNYGDVSPLKMDRREFTDSNYTEMNYLTWEKNIEIQNDYGFYLQQAGDHQEAVGILEAVLKKCPDRIPAYLNLGDAYAGLKNRELAIMNYKKYVDGMTKTEKKDLIPDRVLSYMAQ